MSSWWLVLALLLGGLGQSFASDSSFQDRLEQADRARTGDQARFSRLLSGLESDAEAATLEQRQHVALLRAYFLTLGGQTAESISHLERLLAQDPATTLRARAGALLANNYAIVGRFIEGLGTMETTLSLLDRGIDKDARHQVLTTAAILYNLMGQYAIGKGYAERVLADDPGERLRCFARILQLESEIELDTAPFESEFTSAIDACLQRGEQIAAGFARSYLARMLHSKRQTRRAIDVLEEHLTELQETGYPRVLAEVYSLLAKYYLEAGHAGLAQQYAEKTLGQAGQPLSLSVAHHVLYEIAMRNKDPVLALTHYRAYAEADKAYSSEANARETAYQLVRQESETKSQQIALLNRQNEVLKLQQQIDRQSAENMKAVAGLALLLLGAIGYWAWRVKRMEQVLRQQTEIDGLTGVASRQHFCSEAERLLERARSRGTGAAILMFDLDHFKHFNDRHGHDTGDWVLRRAAQACRAACRRDDLVGRLGGEEFAILLVDIGHDGALRVAEACRAEVAAVGTERGDLLLQPSASFGVALTRGSGYGFTQLLTHADKALYQAKHDGRDCVRLYDATAPAESDGGSGARQAGLRLAHSGPGAGGRQPPH